MLLSEFRLLWIVAWALSDINVDSHQHVFQILFISDFIQQKFVVSKLKIRKFISLRSVDESIRDRLILMLLFFSKSAVDSVPDDENSTVVSVDAVLVGSVVELVVLGDVEEEVVDGRYSVDEFRVNPELVNCAYCCK